MKKGFTKAILLVGTAETCPNIEYATGFRSSDPVVYLQDGRVGHLVVPQLEFGRAELIIGDLSADRRSGPRVKVNVLTAGTLNIRTAKQRQLTEWALKLLKRRRIRVVTVPPFFPHGVARRLERAGIRIVITAGELFPGRAVKTNSEIRKIRESQQAAVIAMRSACSMIADSEIDGAGHLRLKGKHLTCEIIRHTITRVLLDHDCLCREIIVAAGRRTANPHEKGEGPLSAHETVVIDIFPQHLVHGYWGDLTRTIVKGCPSPLLKKMYHAVKAAQNAALNRVKPGVKCASVHQCAVDEFKRRGFETTVVKGRSTGFFHSTGHGVGLSIHEAPSISAADGRLRSGNVITIEPGLYYPDIGGVRIEDTIEVTSSGWRYLVPCEKKFEI